MENEEYMDFNEENITEELSEFVTEDVTVDSGSDNSNIVIDNNIVPETVVDDSLEYLLKEYIKSTLEENEEETVQEEVQEEDQADDETEIEIIDYTDLLKDISDKSDIINSTQEIILSRSIEYDENNVLSADINDISLTNALLVLLFIGVLFTGSINFARGFFK